MKKSILMIGSVAAASLFLSACDVDKTKDGKLPDIDVAAEKGQVPKYDVEVTKKQEGKLPSVGVDVEGGQLPEYEVETADVTIGTKTVEVTVPDVDVEMPDDDDPDN